jgi:hypothetical protein
MYYNTLRVRNLRDMDEFCNKLVSFLTINHKHTSLDKHTNLVEQTNTLTYSMAYESNMCL